MIGEYSAEENRKFDQKINRTNAPSMTQEILMSVMIRKQFDKALEVFDQIVQKTREIIRLERNVPQQKILKRNFLMNYNRL